MELEFASVAFRSRSTNSDAREPLAVRPPNELVLSEGCRAVYRIYVTAVVRSFVRSLARAPTRKPQGRAALIKQTHNVRRNSAYK